MKLPPVAQARWVAMATREKQLILVAIAIVVVALTWWVGISPAWQTLRNAPQAHRSLDAQVQQMKVMAAQVQTLQSQPRAGLDESLRALEASTTQRLGNAGRLTVTGERATLTLRNVPAEALAQWLAQARINAHALPSEARLVRSPAPGSASWDGTLVLNLPPR